MAMLLNQLAAELVVVLEKLLPTIEKEWWDNCVVAKLSYQQQRFVDQQKIDSLGRLDLAALIRIIDQNWHQISSRLDLTINVRHFTKEMLTVRNRWAHASSEGFSTEDVYRDLDTMQRFANGINAKDEFINKISAVKGELLNLETKDNESNGSYNINKQKQTLKNEENQISAFELGQIVCLISNPSIKGAVVEIVMSKPENRYKVFIESKVQTYYASQLKAEVEKEEEQNYLACNQFHAYLSALQIRYPGLSTLYSLNAARVDFIPYQFRPVLRFIRSDRPRLLIADGVGVGKTIEAGLILRELQARRDIRSILVICPRPLVIERKWEIEMKRFEERFTHLDGKTLRYCINEMDMDGVWPEQFQRVILPYSLFDETLLYGTKPGSKQKHRKGLLDLDPPHRFDLVIVDEAHHIRNQDTYSHKAVRFFCDHAEAVIFLTATPIQLGSKDLFVLLNTLRPDLIIDKNSFEHMAEPNPFINEAVSIVRSRESGWSKRSIELLQDALATSWGQSILKNSPDFLKVIEQLSQAEISEDERVQLITEIEALHTFSGIINRTRRRDIGEFTVRKPETVVVEFTPEQKRFHDELLEVQAEIYNRLHGNTNINFMMTTIRRQAASCLYGLAPLLKDILSRHFDEFYWDETEGFNELPDTITINDNLEQRILTLLESAKKLDPNDTKLESLIKIIRNKQLLENNKIMLFSSFRHTLSYLYKHLKEEGFRVAMVHGGTPDEERVATRDRLALHRDHKDCLDILLFSEIGCEGLDYQFCDCIVNYDLPWNPMRVEQRIGRIDRKGQMSESVAIYNMITPGTVDADIYERCLLRIGVFNQALGSCEEILGEITKEIHDIAENFTLNEEDRRAKLQQLADNKIRLIQEQEELEQRQLELFGIRLPEEQLNKEIEEASSFWLVPESIKRLVTLYLQKTCKKDQEFLLGEKPLKTLRLSQESRNALLQDYQKMPRQNNIQHREWEGWLKGGSQHMIVTFEADCASQNPNAAFLTPIHPLVKQAALSYDRGKRVVTSLNVNSNKVPQGKYEFAIYQWQYHGIREDLVLRPVASSETVTPFLPELLIEATANSDEKIEDSNLLEWDNLDSLHYKLWNSSREKHRQKTTDIAGFRRESLSTSHQARMSLLLEQMEQANDEKIKRMRQAQIEAAENDYARRSQEIDIAVERADITTEAVAYGVIHVIGSC